MKIHKYVKYIVLLVILILTAGGLWVYFSQYSSQSRASQDMATVSYDNDAMPTAEGEEQEMRLQIQTPQGISGFNLVLQASDGLVFQSVGQEIETVPAGKEGDFSKVLDYVSDDGKTAKASYVAISASDEELPQIVSVSAQVQSKSDDTGQITVLVDESEVTGPSGVTYAVESEMSQSGSTATDASSPMEQPEEDSTTDGDSMEIDEDESQDDSLDLVEDESFKDQEEPLSPEDATMTLSITTRFQGVQDQSSPTDSLDSLVYADSQGSSSTPQTVPFSYAGSGLWAGSVPLDVEPGSDYVVYMKAGKHLQRKICETSPTEEQEGAYRCEQGSIELQEGENELDFSGIILLAGDITGPDDKQDGLIDANDLAFVRNNLGVEDQSVIERGDINMDGVIDTQDYSLITATLSQAGRNADDQ